jgi:alkanesulfonate monooxygenase SsuD/methylene tetrahydromethanopterin reductase-like flavin-dependent oxidoreductase (luciferase family)
MEEHKYKIGFLEFGMLNLSTFQANSHINGIVECIKTAAIAEKAGFSRFWVGEHHSMDSLWRTPDTIATLLCAHTDTIRIGVAGVLIAYHNPYLIAQQYKLLNNIYNNRVDLGYARGGISLPGLQQLITGGKPISNDTYNENVLQTEQILNTGLNHLTPIPPFNLVNPARWILASSPASIDFAAAQGINICISLCHKDIDDAYAQSLQEALARYRATTTGSGLQTALLANIVCAPSAKQANAIAATKVYDNFLLNFAGDSNACQQYISDTLAFYGTNEIIIGNIFKDPKDKLRTIKGLAALL